jgi:hypothetical protein
MRTEFHLRSKLQFLIQKMHLGELEEHNNFDPGFYPNENSNIVDIKVSDKLLIELTNPKETTWIIPWI